MIDFAFLYRIAYFLSLYQQQLLLLTCLLKTVGVYEPPLFARPTFWPFLGSVQNLTAIFLRGQSHRFQPLCYHGPSLPSIPHIRDVQQINAG